MSFAKSILLNASNFHIPLCNVSTIFKLRSLVSRINLITHNISLNCNLEAPSIILHSSQNAFAMLRLECFVKNSKVPTPDQYCCCCCCFSFIQVPSSFCFAPTNPGVPGVNIIHCFSTSFPCFFGNASIIVGWPNHALFFFFTFDYFINATIIQCCGFLLCQNIASNH